MAYFRGLTVCGYFSGEHWLCRLMAMGWIEHGRPFETGDVPAGLVQKAQPLRREFEETFAEASIPRIA